MPITPTPYDPKESAEQKPYELAPVGIHPFHFYSLVDLGTHDDTDMKGNPVKKRYFQFGFELSNAKMSDGRPFAVFKKFALQLSKYRSGLRATGQSNAYQFLKQFRPSVCLKADGTALDSVDLGVVASLLGQAGTLVLVHKPSRKDPQKKYPEIQSFLEDLMMPIEPMVNPIQNFLIGDPLEQSFPKWLQEMILSSDEAKAGLYGHTPQGAAAQAKAGEEEHHHAQTQSADPTNFDDDIPF